MITVLNSGFTGLRLLMIPICIVAYRKVFPTEEEIFKIVSEPWSPKAITVIKLRIDKKVSEREQKLLTNRYIEYVCAETCRKYHFPVSSLIASMRHARTTPVSSLNVRESMQGALQETGNNVTRFTCR